MPYLELCPVPYFQVVASDNGSPIKSSSATVYIHLLDDNNKNPVFDQSTYFLTVKDSKYS